MVPPLSCHFSVHIIPSCGGGGGGGGGGGKQQLYALRFCSVFSDSKGLIALTFAMQMTSSHDDAIYHVLLVSNW
jgi:hypothetical protein